MDSKIVSIQAVSGELVSALKTSHSTTKSAKSHGVDSRACGGGTCMFFGRSGMCHLKSDGLGTCTPVIDGDPVAIYYKKHFTAAQVAAHLRQVEHTPTE